MGLNRRTKRRSKFEVTIGKQLPKGTLYEPFSIRFIKDHRYVPDYVLPNRIIIEVKGRFTSVDRKKHILIKEQSGGEWDIRFVFMRNNTLNKNSDTTYTDWCDKHDFLWAIGKVPEEWLL